jgi:hypothetical protein
VMLRTACTDPNDRRTPSIDILLNPGPEI